MPLATSRHIKLITFFRISHLQARADADDSSRKSEFFFSVSRFPTRESGYGKLGQPLLLGEYRDVSCRHMDLISLANTNTLLRLAEIKRKTSHHRGRVRVGMRRLGGGPISCWASMIKVSSGRIREPDGESRAWMTWRFVRGGCGRAAGQFSRYPRLFRSQRMRVSEATLPSHLLAATDLALPPGQRA